MQVPSNLSTINANNREVVDRIIILDPADCGGEPNDISELNVWVNRKYDEENKRQIRDIGWKLNVHNRFEGTADKPFYFLIYLEWLDREGNSQSLGAGGGPYIGSSCHAWFEYDGCDYDSPFCITKLEDNSDMRIGVCRLSAEIGYLEYCEDVDGYVEKTIDTTEKTYDFLDVSDNRQAKNVVNLVGISDKKCIKLSWEKPEIKEHEMDYSWYRIYRDNELIMTVYGSTEYRDCDIKPGNTYKYSVRPLTKWLIEGNSTTCKVEYNPQPIIEVDKEEIDFGIVEPNSNITEIMTFKNQGVLETYIIIETEADWLTINPERFTLQPNESFKVSLTTISEKMIPEQRLQTGIEASWGSNGYKPLYAQVRVGKDVTPPDISIDPLEHVTNATEYEVTGTISENGRIVINSKEANVNSSRFSVIIPIPKAPSKTPVTVWCSDIYGNEKEETFDSITNIMDRTVIMIIGKLIMVVDGKDIVVDPPPTIISGRTMVPVRAVAEAFGAEVDWDGETKTVIINLFGCIIKLPIGSTSAVVDGEETEVDPPLPRYSTNEQWFHSDSLQKHLEQK
jgi:hypothetical protein